MCPPAVSILLYVPLWTKCRKFGGIIREFENSSPTVQMSMTERDGLEQRDIQPRNPIERHTEADRQPHDMHTTPMTYAAQQSKNQTVENSANNDG